MRTTQTRTTASAAYGVSKSRSPSFEYCCVSSSLTTCTGHHVSTAPHRKEINADTARTKTRFANRSATTMAPVCDTASQQGSRNAASAICIDARKKTARRQTSFKAPHVLQTDTYHPNTSVGIIKHLESMILTVHNHNIAIRAWCHGSGFVQTPFRRAVATKLSLEAPRPTEHLPNPSRKKSRRAKGKYPDTKNVHTRVSSSITLARAHAPGPDGSSCQQQPALQLV